MQELILTIAEELTGSPRERMELNEPRPGHFRLLLEPRDMGKLIGREGRVIKAIRALLEAAAAAQGEREATLDVDEKRG